MCECNPIKDYINLHPEWTITSLAAACGIARVTLSRVINRRVPPSSLTIIKISGRIGELSASSLIDGYYKSK